MITFEQFQEVEIKIGEILSAEKIEGADKLLKLMVNFGIKSVLPELVATANPVVEEREVRQIVSGIAPHFSDIQSLVGVKCAFVTNLAPRVIRGVESNGMILATGGDGEPFTLLVANADTKPGAKIR